MENYYFIQKNGVKQGPYNLAELKLQTIYFDELIWRSDNSQWKKVSEFEELQGTFIINPPLTPKEQKIYEVNNKFKNKILKDIALIYVLTCIVISIFSFVIAQSSWDKYLKDTEGKYLGTNNYNNYSSGMVSNAELDDNKRYPYYTPGMNNESSYGYGQGFIFRPFKAFFSTVYLTDEEQANSGVLFKNLTLSSFFSLSFVFLIAGSLYYVIKRSNINDEIMNSNENN